MYKFRVFNQNNNQQVVINTRPKPIMMKRLVFKGRKITNFSHSCSSCK